LIKKNHDLLENGTLLLLEADKVFVCDLVTLLAVDDGVSIVEVIEELILQRERIEEKIEFIVIVKKIKEDV
jgi:hypothetical protein